MPRPGSAPLRGRSRRDSLSVGWSGPAFVQARAPALFGDFGLRLHNGSGNSFSVQDLSRSASNSGLRPPPVSPVLSRSLGSRRHDRRAQSAFGAVLQTNAPPRPRAMASSGPLPPVSRLRDASSRTKGSITRSSSASSMPGPSSSTTMRTPSSYCSTCANVRPPWVAAFSSRLRSARSGAVEVPAPEVEDAHRLPGFRRPGFGQVVHRLATAETSGRRRQPLHRLRAPSACDDRHDR